MELSRSEILKKAYEKYDLKEDGLHYEDMLVSYGKPLLTEKILRRLPEGKESYRYKAKLVFPDGTESGIRELDSLNRVSCFDLWQCPQASPKENFHVTRMLQLQAALMEAKEETVCGPGLQECRGHPVYVLGDIVIDTAGLPGKILLKTIHPYSDIRGIGKEDLLCGAVKALTMMPGVTEELFYGSLMGITKPISHRAGIDANYALAITGPSGHLKTSMAKKYCLWLRDKPRQQTSFSSGKTMKRILEEIDAHSGMNYLVDDFHEYVRTQDMDRQEKRLDDLVRHIEENPDCANVIITGEFIHGIFSSIDRLFVIQIPQMGGEELKEAKEKLTEISDSLMPAIAYAFAERLLDNLEEAENMCKQFYREHINPERHKGNADITRTYRHGLFLQMTELLFRKYICNGSKELSRKEELDMAIQRQYDLQQEQLMRIKADRECDYVREVFQMLNGSDRYITIITDPDQYGDYERSCLQRNDRIYITRTALLYGLSMYLNRRIYNINRIIRQLEDAEVLSRGTDSVTKKFRGVRHYVIRTSMRKLYESVRMG